MSERSLDSVVLSGTSVTLRKLAMGLFSLLRGFNVPYRSLALPNW